MILINRIIESNSARKMADLEDPTIWDDGDVSCVRDFVNSEFKSATLFVISLLDWYRRGCVSYEPSRNQESQSPYGE